MDLGGWRSRVCRRVHKSVFAQDFQTGHQLSSTRGTRLRTLHQCMEDSSLLAHSDRIHKQKKVNRSFTSEPWIEGDVLALTLKGDGNAAAGTSLLHLQVIPHMPRTAGLLTPPPSPLHSNPSWSIRRQVLRMFSWTSPADLSWSSSRWCLPTRRSLHCHTEPLARETVPAAKPPSFMEHSQHYLLEYAKDLLQWAASTRLWGKTVQGKTAFKALMLKNKKPGAGAMAQRLGAPTALQFPARNGGSQLCNSRSRGSYVF